MGMEQEAESRIIALETKLAYLEDFVQQLQGVCVEHTQTIEALRAEQKLLAEKVRDMAQQLEGDIPNRKPPHY